MKKYLDTEDTAAMESKDQSSQEERILAQIRQLVNNFSLKNNIELNRKRIRERIVQGAGAQSFWICQRDFFVVVFREYGTPCFITGY